MNEAKHLSEPSKAEPAAATDPAVFAPAEPAVGLEAVSVTAHAVEAAPDRPERPRKRRGRRLLNTLLILALVGLVAFGAGVAVALSLIDGALDQQAGWVKDSLSTLKELAQHLK